MTSRLTRSFRWLILLSLVVPLAVFLWLSADPARNREVVLPTQHFFIVTNVALLAAAAAFLAACGGLISCYWLIPRQALEEVVQAHPQTALHIIENMADKIIELVTLASDLSLKTVEARFAKLLLEQTEGDVIERRRWTTQTELAAHLGTVPDVLSRVTRQLTKAGLIEMDKQQIRILDRKGLAERAMMQEK